MADSSATLIESADSTQVDTPQVEAAVVEDVLVEEVSIDGMCGVY